MFISQAKLDRLRSIQHRTNKKGQPIKMANFAQSVVELDNIMQQITFVKRKEIIKSAEPIALAAYKNLIPQSNKAHKFYIGGKGLKYNILPGNLKRSIKIISDEKNFKNLNSAIGPLYKDAGKGATLSNDNKTDGFYAHMVYGNTRAWVQKVKNKAERASQSAVIQKMSTEAIRAAQQYPRKFWEI